MKLELSLKGQDGRWQGIGRTSTMLPGPATWRKLDGCYINNDGTEIRRMPGCRIAGHPFAGVPFDIDSMTTGTPTTITLDATAFEDGDPRLRGSDSIGGRKVVYISGNSDVPNGWYDYTRTGKTTFTIAVTTSGGGSTDGKVWVQRQWTTHAITSVDNRPAIVYETLSNPWTGTAWLPKFSMGTVIGSRPLSFDDPEYPGYATDPEVGMVYWPNPASESFRTTEPLTEWGWSMNILRRMQVDVLNGRLLIAVPGHGCMFECNLRAGLNDFPLRPPTYGNADHRWTKALGIPRGMLKQVQTANGVAGTSLVSNTTYQVAVGYYDYFTGEVGLPSEPVSITTSATGVTDTNSVTITAYKPRFALPETAGLGVIFYITEAGGNELAPVAIYPPYSTANDRADITGTQAHTVKSPPNHDLLVHPRYWPVVEQMPFGSGDVSVVRGRCVFGASRPFYWTIAGWWDRDLAATPPFYRVWLPFDGSAGLASEIEESPAAYGRVPHLFSGARLYGIDSGFYSGRVIGTDYTGDATYPHAIEIDFDPDPTGSLSLPTVGASEDKSTFLLKNWHELVGYSEEGVPSVSSGILRLEVDQIRGYTSTAIGRLGDAALVFTERSTTLYTWSTEPRKASSMMLSTIYGCISPGSVVEGPFGAAWFSHDGPCVFRGGGVEWIGRDIEPIFREYARDSEGHMPYVSAAVDTERELVIWTVRHPDALTEQDSETGESEPEAITATDKQLSRLPGTYLLVWSYATGQWATTYRDGRIRVQQLGVCVFDDGRERVVELPVNHYLPPTTWQPIFGWDENAARYAQNTITWTATADKAAGVFTSTGISDATDSNKVSAGEQVLIRTPAGECRFFGICVGESPDDQIIVADPDTLNADGAVWKTGDILHARCIHMSLETNRLRIGQEVGFDSIISGVVLRCDVTADYAWARVRVEKEDGTIVYLTKRWGDRIYDGTKRFAAGSIRGTELRVLIDIVSTGRVNVKDIALEGEASERS